MSEPQDDLQAKLAQLIAQAEEVQRQIERAKQPTPEQRRAALRVIKGGLAAAATATGISALGSWLRLHVGTTAVLAATGGALMLTPSLSPYVEPLPPQAEETPTAGPTLEPKPERPTGDTEPDANEREPAENIPADIPAAAEPTEATAPTTDSALSNSAQTPRERRGPPSTPPGQQREEKPRESRKPELREPWEPERQEPPEQRPCLELDVPPRVELPACLEEVTELLPE